ncbi:hypothetical protein PDE_06358 [Penicillium oxalicum 114-2]|uniref:Uncharacterized protein n=1 Tax=Penicillium oxalicum (strain 114-2 / CGMCC 5302) TaxID=933388 RepID=S8AYG2_PENO1|nr:hypothetical protein PDE_06358 [Penicillium oxalicum 114-2]
MDLSSLERPAVLCQCLRCSSSLAVLENEWGKLSSVYAVPTAWLSVNLQRISVAQEQKHIPQTSEMSMLRGRFAQEVSCKLCQQKLAVLCGLDDGPHVLWKMSKVSFRDIVTMRTAEPLFKDGALDKLFQPRSAAEPFRQSVQPMDENALVPTSSQDMVSMEPSMHRQMQHHNRSIDQISNSVNTLHDTMADLKHSFTSLRLELNAPSRNLIDNDTMKGPGFDMIATVLKELKCKSEENEKMKLEMETLKLKNRMMEEYRIKSPAPQVDVPDQLTEVQSPGLLQAGKKRAWPDAFTAGRAPTVADSFDEDDMADDLTLDNLPDGNSRVSALPVGRQLPSRPAQSQIQYEINQTSEKTVNRQPQPSGPKRQRLNPQKEDTALGGSRKVGRPRKSNGPQKDAEPSPAPAPAVLAGSETSTQVPLAPASPEPPTAKRRRLRRSTRSQSFGLNTTAQNEATESSTLNLDPALSQETGQDVPQAKDKTQPSASTESIQEAARMTDAARQFEEEKRKAKIAARDAQIRRVMEQEEEMETDGSR